MGSAVGVGALVGVALVMDGVAALAALWQPTSKSRQDNISKAKPDRRMGSSFPQSWQTVPQLGELGAQAEQDIPLEQVYSAWTVSEDPEVRIQALQKLIDNGVTHIFVHSLQADQARVVSFYGEQVLPRLSQKPLAESRR